MKKLLISYCLLLMLTLRLQLFAQVSLVRDINISPAQSGYGNIVRAGNISYFTCNSLEYGNELWRTDGTEAGTFMVKDIFPGSNSGSPSGLTNVDGILYFCAEDGLNGYELWKSNGSASGTVMVKDIWPGPNSGRPHNIINVNGVLFFAAETEYEGRELWKSDGTSNGTIIVKDIIPGSQPGFDYGSPQSIFTANGLVYFVGRDNMHGSELWRSNGTEIGTFMLKDIKPGNGSGAGFPLNFASFNGNIYFQASTDESGTELWKSDGTSEGTMIVKDIWPGTGSGCGYLNGLLDVFFSNFSDALFFYADNGQDGIALWKSDGTTAGTEMIKPFPSQSAMSPPLFFSDLNGSLLFAGFDDISGRELWKTDGSESGTFIVKDINPGSAHGIIYAYYYNGISSINFKNQVYFIASDGTSGDELWRTDGSYAGTELVKDIFPGASHGIRTAGRIDGNFFCNAGEEFYFVANDGINGDELWKSNGTATGTVLVKSIENNNSHSSITGITNIDGTIYFNSNNWLNGSELWKSDGTESGTVMVKDIWSGFGSGMPQNFATDGSKLYFAASDGIAGSELWRSDGTQNGTFMLKDIRTGPGGSNPKHLKYLNGSLYFYADDNTNGNELWKSNGTAEGTILVKDINPGILSSIVAPLTPDFVSMSNLLFFASYNNLYGYELWCSDGTSNGTKILKDLVPGSSQSGYPRALEVVDNKLLFLAYTENYGFALWKSDGSAEGTLPVKQLCEDPFLPSLISNHHTSGNGILFFSASDCADGYELWKSDGSENGTFMLRDIFQGPNSSAPDNLTYINGVLYFVADDGINGRELWKSDGTESGTMLLKDIIPGPASSIPRNLLSFKNKLYFIAPNQDGLDKLWESDGTESGTKLTYTGNLVISPNPSLTSSGDNLFMSGSMNNSGYELLKFNYLSTDVKEILLDKTQHLVYPNPAEGVINVKLVNDEPALFQIIDILGRKVISKLLTTGNNQFSVENLTPGIYLYMISNGSSYFTGKILIR